MIPPPRPDVALPVKSVINPLFPDDEAPLFILIAPLTPPLPEFPVVIVSVPLDVLPLAEEIDTFPPVAR